MKLLDSFVAGALLQRVRSADPDDRVPACTSFRGAALFVDISKYTTRAEALCSNGDDGVEQLGAMLDRAFRDSVATVHDTGGEVACFAGDAFVAYWPADDGNMPRAVQRAYRCAQRLHALSQAAVAVDDDSVPPLHIGISAGPMWAAHLGADERWQLLLTGRSVREACAAAAGARDGETAVAPGAALFVATSPDEPLGDSASQPSGTVVAKPALDVAPYVPARVQAYAREGYARWMAQRRTICALFVRIDGLDDTALDALRRYQTLVYAIHTALRPYTGSSGTLLQDDKGLVFTLCLGMPNDAHAADALRAVRAGLAIEAEVRRLGLTSAMGVAAGSGICMTLGGPSRRHYWAVGRFMHIAGRLMAAAGNGLLCTPEVANQVRHVVSLSPERPILLKGVQRPIRPYRVQQVIPVDVHAEAVYGREREQAALDDHLDAFEQRRGAVLWVVGGAGLGKTTLAQYLRRQATQRGIKCLSGGSGSVVTMSMTGASEMDRRSHESSRRFAVAYAAWRPVFADLLHTDTLTEDEPQAERHRRLGAIKHEQLGPLMNAVVPGFVEDTPIVRTLSGQARADATAALLSEVLGIHAGSRFLLVLEDCHWMDSASWRLVLRVAQDYPEALIVLTSRPPGDARDGAADSDELNALKRVGQFAELPVSPLAGSAIAAIVESVVGDMAITPELLDEINERAKGNPLFAREYALLLTTELGAQDDVPVWSSLARRGAAAPVPHSVETLIASRLDALSPSEDLALKVASVIGDRFSSALVARAIPTDPHGQKVEATLAKLTRRQLLVDEETNRGDFAFHHATIREVAYQQLTPTQRQDLHRRVAEAMEREYEHELGVHMAMLAHHWVRANQPDAAVKYSDEAAVQALAAGAFEEAERLLTICIQLVTEGRTSVPTVERIRWQRQLADARHGMGRLEPRIAAAHQALRLGRCHRPQSAIGLIAHAAARLLGMALRWSFASKEPPPDPEHVMDIARAYRHSAEVCYFNNDIVGMLCDSVSAVSWASRLKPSAVLAGAASELGGIVSVAGLRRTGERILEQAIVTADDAADQAAQAYAHMINCLYYVGRGDWRSAERSAQRCQELCEPMDDRVNWTNAQAVRFWMCYYRCYDAAAYEAACRLRDRASETGNAQHRAWALRCLAVCAMRRGQYAEAATQLHVALECLGETAALNERVPTLGLLSLAQLRSDQVWAARATAQDAVAQVARIKRPIGYGVLEGYSSLTEVALEAWRDERSKEWKHAVEACVRLLRRYSKNFPVGRPRYLLHLGDYRRISGRLAAARRCYRSGEAAAQRLGMPWDASRCRAMLDELAHPAPDSPN